MDNNSIQHMSDHDLLITLHSEMKGIRNEIVDLKDGVKDQLKDHENRIRRLELWGSIALGLLYAIQFYYNYLHKVQ